MITELHLADICPTCKLKRDLNVDCRARTFKLIIPGSCTDKAQCERAIREAAQFLNGAAA